MSETGATIVFGLGATGRSVIAHLQGDTRLIGVDTRDDEAILSAVAWDFPSVECITLDAYDAALERAKCIVVSPGISIDDPLVERARHAGLEVTSDIEIFLDAVNAPVIGVTGTNGKSTVATLIGHLLDRAGIEVATGGNLSPPALDLIAPGIERYVLELSSFQLERLENPGIDVAVLLNLTDDHLDRHGTLENYARTKRRIFDGARALIFNADDEATHPRGCSIARSQQAIALGSSRWRVSADHVLVDGVVIERARLPLFGEHNAFNVLAALATVGASGVPIDDAMVLLDGYQGLPHRGSVVATVDGIRFVDDSKATNVGATAAALAGDSAVILIAGGDGKGASFEPLVELVERHVEAAVLIGRDAPRLASVIGGATEVEFAASMDDAVAKAIGLARAKRVDCVLLSPACASLDMFSNFAERGDAFASAARDIATAAEKRG